MNNTDQKLINRQENEALLMLKESMKVQSRLFYRISSLSENEFSIEELLDKTVELISEGWKNPEPVAANIEYNRKSYKTARYIETSRVMSAKAKVRKKNLLVIKIAILEDQADFDPALIMEEKQHLLDLIAIHLALKIDKILSQKELAENQRLFDKVYKLARIGTWEYDMLAHKLHWSPVTKEVHGFGQDYKPDVESTIKLFKEGVNRDTFAKAAYDAIEHQKPFDIELKIISGQGDERWIRATGEPEYKDGICTRFYGISQNVSERKLQEQQILESLKEKETLLAEIHHRVKNNLAVVTGLLQLQAASENNSEVTDRLCDSIVRIQTMANIHEQLYQSNSFSRLEFTDNIRRLASNILQTFQPETDIEIDFNCDPIQLNIKQAMPSSLIVNEIITNILKHAFPERKKGKIVISLAESEKKGQITLSIRDNGVGLPEDFNIEESNSLGLNLIEVLSQQLKADFTFDSSNEGTIFTLLFKKAG